MTFPDIIIIIGLTIFIFMGIVEGFMRKLFGIMIILIGFYISIQFYIGVADWIHRIFKIAPVISAILAFLFLFFGILIGGNILFRVTGKGGGGLYRTWDRIAGGAFGMLEGAIVISLMLHLLSFVDIPSTATRDASLIYPIIYNVAPFLFEALNIFLPEIREFFDLFLNDVEIPNNINI